MEEYIKTLLILQRLQDINIWFKMLQQMFYCSMHYLKKKLCFMLLMYYINALLYINSNTEDQKQPDNFRNLLKTPIKHCNEVLYSQVPQAVSSEQMYFILLFYTSKPFPPKNNNLNICIIIMKCKIDFSTSHLKHYNDKISITSKTTFGFRGE